MRKLYAPGNYYRRIRASLRALEVRGPVIHTSRADMKAFFKSLWLLGVWHKGRSGYWGLLWWTLFARPRSFAAAMELSILGHHFRRVANEL
jgi:hypothetical protein